MDVLRLFKLVLLILVGTQGFAQTSLDPKLMPPKHHAKFYSPKITRSIKAKKSKVTRTAQYEFYKRVEKAAKEKQRILRKLSKPQYSNPANFGHKHKPRKRPPHRMRYCDVCHIRH